MINSTLINSTNGFVFNIVSFPHVFFSQAEREYIGASWLSRKSRVTEHGRAVLQLEKQINYTNTWVTFGAGFEV